MFREQIKKGGRKLEQMVDFALLLLSVVTPILVIYHMGFVLLESEIETLSQSYRFILIAQWALVTTMLLFGFGGNTPSKRKGATIFFRLSLYLFVTFVAVFEVALHYNWLVKDELIGALTSNAVVMTIIMFVSGTVLSRWITSILGRKTSPSMLLATSFMLIILIGSLLLKLPKATVAELSYIDSLFLSTSAVCVTGLSPVDISQTLTTTGLVILLFLIQIGGLGVMTITSFFGLFFAPSRNFAGQMVVGDLLSTNKINELLRLLANIIIVTLSIEAIGALFLFSSFSSTGQFSVGESWFLAIFHSISAFCNAGFSPLSGNLADPVIAHLNTTRWVVGFLIIFGGIGFPIFSNFLRYLALLFTNTIRKLNGIRPKIHPRMWHLNTYIVLRVTLFLVVGGWVAMLLLEWNASLLGMSLPEKLSHSFLMAITPRTAGFNGVEMGAMLPASILITTLLMWIGGAPQSTAGGIKVTVAYIAICNIFSSNKSSAQITTHYRHIPASSIYRAFGVITLSISVIATAVLIITIFDGHLGIGKITFEVVSALSTVGLSLGITAELSNVSKAILIVLMFVGRVGLISVLVLFFRPSSLRPKPYTYPEEDILIT